MAWRGLLSLKLQPKAVRSGQMRVTLQGFLLVSRGPLTKARQAGGGVMYPNLTKWPRQIQSLVLGSLAAGIFKIH